MSEPNVFKQQAEQAIAAERRRQVEQLGFTAERDNQNYARRNAGDRDDDLHRAAACYFNTATDFMPIHLEVDWPWRIEAWKPGTIERNLIKAGALWQADIERIERRDAVRSVLNQDASSARVALRMATTTLAMIYRDRAEQAGPVVVAQP
jgi:hypothetical protein